MTATIVQAEHEAQLAAYKRAILLGWQPQTHLVGVKCQICEKRIWQPGYVRPGDEWSPALYRHEHCHQGDQ